jgi:hypothetical protein
LLHLSIPQMENAKYLNQITDNKTYNHE